MKQIIATGFFTLIAFANGIPGDDVGSSHRLYTPAQAVSIHCGGAMRHWRCLHGALHMVTERTLHGQTLGALPGMLGIAV